MNEALPWWVQSKTRLLVTGTLYIAVPFSLVFGTKMYDRGVLTFRNVLFLVVISVGVGLLFSGLYGMSGSKRKYKTSSDHGDAAKGQYLDNCHRRGLVPAT